jgi:hypothetical protein
MAGITLAQAQTQLDAYLAAETAVLGGQEYTIAGRRLVRADLEMIQKGIELWQSRVLSLNAKENAEGGKGRSARMRPGW